ncbi:hypothetical protein Q8F55_007545 [Vanrija albida]|uniref:C2H2-type domain-containing protein n=1 Tax=Vanrija albida TaxID=181172 RepID=A0ABR3PTU8_9TREE
MVAEQHPRCGTCSKTFPAGGRARAAHLNATGHAAPAHECDRCFDWFNSENACWAHMNAKNHFYWQCRDDDCYITRPTEHARELHEHNAHLYCGDCYRHFDSANNLKMHLNSRMHRSDTLECPACDRNFVSATGLAHHLERGSCPRAPNLDRMGVYRLVRELDPNNWFTNKDVELRKVTYSANEGAWNGCAFECPKCPREFGSLRSLNQHLASPTHLEYLYHCQKSCTRQFKTFGAVCNHLESESCGAMTFNEVQRYMQSVVSSNRLITAY